MNIGIIYRIFYGDLSYIGSTTNLKERMIHHMSNYNNCSSKKIMCYDDFEVEVLAEIYYVENHLDKNLRNLEREYMEQYVCVNKSRPIITEEESKEYNKQHYLKNHDEILEYQKQHYLKNRDEKLEYQKQHYLKNRDEKLEYKKQYDLKNRDKIKEYHKQYDKEYRLKKKLNKNLK
jgi:hypothetical protein